MANSNFFRPDLSEKKSFESLNDAGHSARVELIEHPHQTTDSLISFLNTVMRPGVSYSIKDEFPSVFGEYPGGDSLVAYVGNRIASHVSFITREYRHESFVIKIGLIGGVATHPDFENLGLASHLVKKANEHLKSRGCTVALLWSEMLDYYCRFNFFPMGHELDLKFSAQSVPSFPVEVEEVEPDKWARQIWRLYMKKKGKLDRSLEEQTALLRIPKCRVFITQSKGDLESFLVINKGADFKDYIHEWGGDLISLQRMIAHLQKHEFSDINLVLIGPGDEDLSPLREMAEVSWKGILGLMCILEPSQMERIYFSYLAHKNIAYALNQKQDVLEVNGREYAYRTAEERLKVYFGCADEGPHLPLFLWGFDSI